MQNYFFQFLLFLHVSVSSFYERQCSKFDGLRLRCSIFKGTMSFTSTLKSFRKQLSQFSNLNLKFTDITTDKRVQVFCLSDIHADIPRNFDYVKNLVNKNGPKVNSTETCSLEERFLEKSSDDEIYSILVCPGDAGSDVKVISEICQVLVDKFDLVCYVPGNHEAWLSNENFSSVDQLSCGNSVNSFQKLSQVMQCAVENGVHVGPVRVSTTYLKGIKNCQAVNNPPTKPTDCLTPRRLVIMPLQSWYHSGFDTEPDLIDPDFLDMDQRYPFLRRWGDFSKCYWPADVIAPEDFKTVSVDNRTLASAFASLNEPLIDEYLSCRGTTPPTTPCTTGTSTQPSTSVLGSTSEEDTLLTFSHFLPRQELCPEKRFVLEPRLTRVIGSYELESQIRRLRPQLHLFGHTHIPIDITLDGQRYLQWPLGYPREGTKQCAVVRSHGPLLVYDSSLEGDGIPAGLPSLDLHWSRHYRHTPRDPNNMTLSPWLRARLDGFRARLDDPNPLVKLLEKYQTSSNNDKM